VPKKKSALPKFVQLHLGPLPIDIINATLSMELEPGPVVFSAPAQQHAYRRHPEDFQNCLPFAGSVVANPLMVGDDYRNPGKIELVSRVQSLGSGLLVAIAVEMDPLGQYHVTSLYPISYAKIERRVERRFLFRAKTKGLT
jgi:phage-Barnase-EndoU-ColicinE5/D-RelE like nuclease3